MKVLFIYPDIREEEGCIGNTMQGSYKELGGMFYMGLAYISAVLKQGGHDTKLVHITDMSNAPKIHETINKWNPDLIAYSATTNMFPYVCKINNEVKKYDIPQVLGGVHATLDPEPSLKESQVDYVVVGEGEYPLLELCDGQDKHEINNLCYFEGGKFIKNPLRPLIDLDELPPPDWDLFDYMNCYDGNIKRLNVVLSRGCPFKCSYCCNHALATIYEGFGSYIRFPSPDKAMEIIKDGLAKYPELEYVDFRDDNLPLIPKWFEAFSLKYYKEINLPSVCIARVNQLSEYNIHLLKRYMQCRMVRIGVETGNEYMKKLCNRKISNESVIEAFRLLHKYDIKTYAFYMIGLPFETPAMFLDTIKLHSKLNTNLYHLSVFYPFKNTKSYEMCKKEWFTEKEIPDYFHESILNQPTFSNTQIKWFIKRFELLTKLYKLKLNSFIKYYVNHNMKDLI